MKIHSKLTEGTNTAPPRPDDRSFKQLDAAVAQLKKDIAELEHKTYPSEIDDFLLNLYHTSLQQVMAQRAKLFHSAH